MANVKQVIVIRKDLNMPQGKLAAQVAHASTGAFLKHFNNNSGTLIPKDSGSYQDNVEPWLTDEFTKICLRVDSEDELMNIYYDCIESGIPHSLIKDAAHTFFNEPTYTCLGIGPFESRLIDNITGHLSLYR